jgi:hypothetical protein
VDLYVDTNVAEEEHTDSMFSMIFKTEKISMLTPNVLQNMDTMFLLYDGIYLQVHMVLQPRRQAPTSLQP